jgi:hypothetical protein
MINKWVAATYETVAVTDFCAYLSTLFSLCSLRDVECGGDYDMFLKRINE